MEGQCSEFFVKRNGKVFLSYDREQGFGKITLHGKIDRRRDIGRPRRSLKGTNVTLQ